MGHLFLVAVDPLGGTCEDYAATAIGRCQACIRREKGVVLPCRAVLPLHHHIPTNGRIAVLEQHMPVGALLVGEQGHWI